MHLFKKIKFHESGSRCRDNSHLRRLWLFFLTNSINGPNTRRTKPNTICTICFHVFKWSDVKTPALFNFIIAPSTFFALPFTLPACVTVHVCYFILSFNHLYIIVSMYSARLLLEKIPTATALKFRKFCFQTLPLFTANESLNWPEKYWALQKELYIFDISQKMGLHIFDVKASICWQKSTPQFSRSSLELDAFECYQYI